MRYTETLSFGHGSHLSQHRLRDQTWGWD